MEGSEARILMECKIKHNSPQRDIRALFIFPGKIKTLGDVLAVAKSLGKEVFRTKEDIYVFPFAVPFPFIEGSYLVVIERGQYKEPVVRGG